MGVLGRLDGCFEYIGWVFWVDWMGVLGRLDGCFG